MTRGSGICDDLRRHLERCGQCRTVNAEAVRLQRPEGERHSVDDVTLAALCSLGRSIYQAYLHWLAWNDE